MGYEANSPVKQVWLPMDYDLINSYDNDTFGNFAKEYKSKYGIDLHDIFTLGHKIIDSQDYYFVKLRGNYQISAYSVGRFNGSFETPFTQTDAILKYGADIQGSEPKLLVVIAVTNGGSTLEAGQGFSIRLPTLSANIKTIDDLLFNLYEI